MWYILQIHSLGKLLFTSEGEAQEAAKNDLIECFKLLEGELGDKPYFGGKGLMFCYFGMLPAVMHDSALRDITGKAVYESSRKVWMGKGEDQETGKEELIEWCKLLEGELGDKSYFGVETLGFVDIALVPFYNWFIFFKSFADFSFEAERPKLVSWGKRCFKKESVSKSLPNPDQIYAAYLEFQKRL
ncbi:hypothetical protein HYC85_014674 [Camellia sinensis]|uniref:GST C-terminal domain-containing protein n=1 Tax=Camellia sinensis TaxID=4442 RepID=A0A7J7H820_CAMSI|nr:hypothetical protein HYC85_014674 [Camellia sinensis]